MARADLIVKLVQAGVSGDSNSAKTVAEALIAEERSKQHNVLADRLHRAIEVNGAAARRINGHGRHHPAREFVYEMTPRRSLDDLILTKVVERSCRQLVEEQARANVLRAHGLDPRHRMLLVGPPGNGKTSLAEAIADALAVPFLVLRYDAIIASFLGETAGRLKRVFDYAKTIPCVLFLDEFDAIGKERGDVHETGEIKRVVTSLLMQMDELPSYCVIVAASNHPELLDRATWRRFQLRLTLPAPSAAAMTKYFERFLKEVGPKPGIAAKTLVKRLGPLSYAEAEEFALDVRRQLVLSLGEAPVRSVIQDQLALWDERKRSTQATEQQCDEGSPQA